MLLTTLIVWLLLVHYLNSKPPLFLNFELLEFRGSLPNLHTY